MKAGSFENQPVQLQFPDGSQQSLSILEANKNIYSHLKKRTGNAYFNEFVGGHNYVCWRGLISDDLKNIYADRLTLISYNQYK
jgi:enterochelin esterase-like enzyme